MNDNIICGECYRVEALDVWLRFSLVERGAVLRKRGGGGANNYTMRGTRGAVATGGWVPRHHVSGTGLPRSGSHSGQ
jgi:hypothetical protein